MHWQHTMQGASVLHLLHSAASVVQVPDGTRAAVVGFDWGMDQLQFEVTQNGKAHSLSNGNTGPRQEQAQVLLQQFNRVGAKLKPLQTRAPFQGMLQRLAGLPHCQ